jgi:hypothetical protein
VSSPILTRDEAAELYRLSTRQFDRLAKVWNIPHIKVGSRGIRYRRATLLRFMREKEGEGLGGQRT